eukprot:gene19503-8309_t
MGARAVSVEQGGGGSGASSPADGSPRALHGVARTETVDARDFSPGTSMRDWAQPHHDGRGTSDKMGRSAASRGDPDAPCAPTKLPSPAQGGQGGLLQGLLERSGLGAPPRIDASGGMLQGLLERSGLGAAPAANPAGDSGGWVPWLDEGAVTAELRALFDKLDTARCGALGMEELRVLLPPDVGDAALMRVMDELDHNSDGELSFDEFHHFFALTTQGQAGMMRALDVRTQLETALSVAAQRQLDSIAGLLADRSGGVGAGMLFPDTPPRRALHVALLCATLVDTAD